MSSEGINSCVLGHYNAVLGPIDFFNLTSRLKTVVSSGDKSLLEVVTGCATVCGVVVLEVSRVDHYAKLYRELGHC